MKQTNLQNVSALAKTQLYLLQNYLSENNEPWCYHTQFSYFLQIKDLSMPLFHKAVRAVLERHPVLKTVLLFEREEIRQAINPKLAPNIIFQDISPLTPSAQTDWIAQYLLEDRNKPIDVHDRDKQLFRIYIIKRGNESLQFVLVFNHAIWDGWSLAVLLKEIFAHYQALKLKPTLNLQPAVYDYGDFLKYEAEVSNSWEAKEFWEGHLKNHQPFTTERNKNNTDYSHYKPIERMLSTEVTAGLQAAQSQLMVTMKALFIAQFIHMIEEETKLTYNTIGVVTNGRSVQLKNPLTTLGLLWNMAPLCIEKVADEQSHIKNVNRSLAKVSPYGSYPLLNILAEQGKGQLFHAAFNYINFEGANLLPEDSDIEFRETGGLDKFHFPLHLLVAKNPFNKNISLVLNYDTRYYTETEIESKLDQYIAGLIKISQLNKPIK